jgi:hypothetical protein
VPLYRNRATVVFFAHIPKTGGASIERALTKAGASEALKFKGKREYSKSTLQHMHASIYEEAVSADFADYWFTVVRDPFSRFASEFKMKVTDVGGDADINHWAIENFTRYAEYPFTRDNHIRPQVSFLSDRLEVFRFEQGLDDPIQIACSRLGLEAPPTPHLKKGSTNLLEVRPETIDAIRTFYRDDFSRLGYDPDGYAGSFRVVG